MICKTYFLSHEVYNLSGRVDIAGMKVCGVELEYENVEMIIEKEVIKVAYANAVVGK